MSNLLVATDFSEKSIYALLAASRFASAQAHKLTVMHVLEELEGGYGWLLLSEPPDQLEAKVRADAMLKLRKLCHEHLGELDPLMPIDLRIELGAPAEQILRVAQEIDAQLIVVGTLGHGRVMSAFLGSTANQLVRWSERPVMVVPPKAKSISFDHILAPVEMSAVSHHSLLSAAKLARGFGGKVTLLHAIGLPVIMGSEPSFAHTLVPENIEALIAQHTENLERIVDKLHLRELTEEICVVTMDAAQAIEKIAAEHKIDLICMGSHGRRGVMRFLLGNTAERVLRRVPCPVIIYRQEAQTPLFALEDAHEQPSLG